MTKIAKIGRFQDTIIPRRSQSDLTLLIETPLYKTRNRNGDEWSWNPRHRTCIKSFSQYSYKRFKKTKKFAKSVNEEYLRKFRSDEEINLVICNALADRNNALCVEMDKKHPLWLWWAVDHKTNTPLAYTFGTREHKYLDELLKLLEPYSIGRVYADNNYAYKDKIMKDHLVTGKKNTQQM